MTIIFVNRYFYPDESATAQILGDAAFHLAKQGHAVKVICSRMDYNDADTHFPNRETIKGVDTIRVKTTTLGRDKLWRRAADYFSFYISAFFAVLIYAKRGDTLIAKTDPPLLSIPLWLAARLKGARFVNWLQDLYPEVARELGISFVQGRLGRALQSLRNLSLRHSNMNIVIGRRMRSRLIQNGIAKKKITIIQNWSDDSAIKPIAHKDNFVRKEWGFTEDDVVIGYSGNLGRAHDLKTIIGAAKALRNNANIKFLFIGGGKLRQGLKVEIKKYNLVNVILKPYQPREALAQSLSASDIHWASLIPALEGTIVPSKIYGIAAVARPLIFIGDVNGEAGQMIEKYKTGYAVEMGDVNKLVQIISDLADDPLTRRAYGENARKMIDNHCNKIHSLNAWQALAQSNFRT